MTDLRELSTSLLSGAIPIERANPMVPRLQAEPVAARTTFVASFANVTAFDTDDGLVLVDTGSFLLAERTRAALRAATAAPAHTAIWTHGHVDHCFGVELYEREAGRAVRVIAHEAVPRRFARYRLTRGWNRAINTRQFQSAVEFPSEFRAPDEVFPDHRSLDVGGRRFELHHALGETDDHTWVWVPDAGAVCTGDLFIWASPNCGNPQKVQRYPREWAAALRAMDALGAELLCPGHGVPIWGAAAVHRALDDTASYLESLVDQVVTLMNRGAGLDEIVARVAPPAELAARPYLSAVYDEPEFIVRNLYRLYGGWWDGNPAHLKPAPAAELARELASLAGGAAALAARAEAIADPRLACELIELAHQAAPDDAAIRAARGKLYAARAASERSLMARGIFATAAAESRK
ncbi:MAG TPA: alkyl sulfatase dimerization domain-containing protein [Kofleriaceae bacterium]|jgi:glyoxylase-like metal-dependent hydrolase (beta-lactamase superfamily II)|nr:alkyl sulfatase dimerization domain-containing protein [Kofleriaceae bacterium]